MTGTNQQDIRIELLEGLNPDEAPLIAIMIDPETTPEAKRSATKRLLCLVQEKRRWYPAANLLVN